MNGPIDCHTALLHRDAYLRGEGPVALVDAHLADCAGCLDVFLDAALAMPVAVAPSWGFPAKVAAHVPRASNRARRQNAVIGISTLIGVTLGSIVMVAGDSADLDFVASMQALMLAAAVVTECAVILSMLSSPRGIFSVSSE
jgi:hypothetical protein